MKYIIFSLILGHCLFSQFDAMYNNAKQLQRELKDEQALQIYDQILAIDSNQVNALTNGANLSTQIGFRAQDRNIQINYFFKAIDYSKKAIQVAPEKDEPYLSYARSLGRLALISGTKQQLELSKEIKENIDKALKINPENDISWHVLGKWYYKFADLSWFERSIAGIIYGSVPKATFEQAKDAFKNAMNIRPKGIGHRLEYAKTCIALDQLNEARTILAEIESIPITLSIDETYKRQARALLADLN